ncbi:hypothetical protein BDZ89DRAFT_1044165 [Hymenopellis radicata]|nr:hypothetical protein BDZ89DRAFT_1044165 [Hymenopellis radicata]
MLSMQDGGHPFSSLESSLSYAGVMVLCLVAETAAMPGTKPKTEDAPHSLPDNRQRSRADNRRALWVVVVVEEEDWSTVVLADSATSSSRILQPAGVTIIVVKNLQPHSRAYASCGAAGPLKPAYPRKKGEKVIDCSGRTPGRPASHGRVVGVQASRGGGG